MTSKPITTKLSNLLNRINGLAALCSSILILSSCEKMAVYDQYQSIDNTTWGKDKEYYFTFEIEDISVPYDLLLEVRNNNLYPYQNLWLFCCEELPIGPMRSDTIECMLADDFGKWYGHGISLFQSSFPIREAYHFPFKGQYTFSFRQGMRRDNLEGIQEIGFKVIPSSSSAPFSMRRDEGI